MSLSFGVFDHLDASGAPLRDFYEDRLKLTELYDRLGFYCYQVAEHHSTPLGMAPSPSIFLSAVAQRTKRLNFGPLVYTLPLYHPIRLIEEICMLDQMSGGRFQFGVGKGISPIEVGFYGLDPEKLALVTDAGVLGLFGTVQARNKDAPIFPLVREKGMEAGTIQLPGPDNPRGRAQVVCCRGDDCDWLSESCCAVGGAALTRRGRDWEYTVCAVKTASKQTSERAVNFFMV